MKKNLVKLPFLFLLRILILLMVIQPLLIKSIVAIDIPAGAPAGTKCIDYYKKIDLQNYSLPITTFEIQNGTLPVGLEFKWTTGNTFAEISGEPEETGAFAIVLYAKDDDGEATRPLTITINALSAGVNGEFCEGESFTVDDVNYTGVDYSWSENGNGNFTSGTASSPGPTYESVVGDIDPVTLMLTITNQTDNTCVAMATRDLTINRKPVADAGSDAKICVTEGSYSLTGANAENGTISWSSSSGHNGFNNSAVENPVYALGSGDITNGSVDLTIEVTSAKCGSASNSMTLDINPEPTAGVGVTSDDICANENEYQITGSSATNGNISWSTSGDGNFSPNNQALNPKYVPGEGDITFISPSTVNAITLTITVSDPDGVCPAASATITLNVHKPPDVEAGGPGSVIEGTSSTYVVTGASVSSGTFSWDEDGLGDLDSYSILTPTYSIDPDDAGIIQFTLTSVDGFCEESDIHELQILHQPVDLIFVLDISGSMGERLYAGGPTKLQKLRNAIEDFFVSNQYEIQADDQIAAVYFTTQVDMTDGSLVNWLSQGDNLRQNMQSAHCPSSICWTAMGGGLQAAINELISAANTGNGHTKNIILITDGKQNLNPIVSDNTDPIIIDDDSTDPSYDTYDCGVDPESPPTELNGENSVRIYTIGLNVPTDYFQLLYDVAVNTGGITNLQLTNPHELHEFLANNFVDILRESSPQIIDYRYQKSGTGNIRESFIVNNHASHITLKILGERGNSDFYRFRVLKDGVDVTDSGTVTDGDFYRIFSADLPVNTPDGLIQAGGEWNMEFAGSPDREYQAVGMVSEHRFRYRCSAGNEDYVTGENLKLEAEVRYLDRDLTDARVTCYVLKPGEDLGNLVSNTSVVGGLTGRKNVLRKDIRFLRRTYIKQAFRDHTTAADLKSGLLIGNPAIIEQLMPDEHIVELHYRDGKFRGIYGDTDLNGAYRLIFKIMWEDEELGTFIRTESRSVVVRFGVPDENNTEIFAIPPFLCYRNWRVIVRPVDRFGNLLGPGFANKIDAGKNTRVVDNLEGSYTVIYSDRDLPDNADVQFYLNGRKFYSGTLDKISTQIPKDIRKLRRNPARMILPVRIK